MVQKMLLTAKKVGIDYGNHIRHLRTYYFDLPLICPYIPYMVQKMLPSAKKGGIEGGTIIYDWESITSPTPSN
jgi:hypothetical protein